jgi:hypothetical protein
MAISYGHRVLRALANAEILYLSDDANVAEIITRQMQSSWVERPSDFTRTTGIFSTRKPAQVSVYGAVPDELSLNLSYESLPLDRQLTVTAEVAGSSPVVPAIHSKRLMERMDLK